MKATTGTWILLVAMIAAPICIWWSSQDAPALANVAATAAPPARNAALARNRVQPVAQIDRDAIAQDLRVVDRIALARKQRDEDDAVVSDLIWVASSSCKTYDSVSGKVPLPQNSDLPSMATVRHDAMRAWAYDYLEQACAGFDAKATLEGWRPQPWDVAVANREGDSATATALALDALRTSESSSELMRAFIYLADTPDNPIPPFGNEPGERVYMLEFALAPLRCRGLGMCGTHNVFVASACLREGCAPGTTMESYWRSKLTPAQITAALKLRADLAHFRQAKR